MAAADKIEETIKDIAVKHGIALGRDDPILILQTINDRLMQDSATAQRDILERGIAAKRRSANLLRDTFNHFNAQRRENKRTTRAGQRRTGADRRVPGGRAKHRRRL